MHKRLCLISTQLPSKQLPVFIIGAGGIVNEAHLPAYQKAGFNVQGIFDIDRNKARATADKFNIPHVFETIDEMLSHSPANAVFDVAVPGSDMIDVLGKLPAGSTVLLQKPMGENYTRCKENTGHCKRKENECGS